jgi:hypothetical protein
MLISTSTDVYSAIGQVASSTLSGFWGFIIFITGVILGFYLLDKLLNILYPTKIENNTEI